MKSRRATAAACATSAVLAGTLLDGWIALACSTTLVLAAGWTLRPPSEPVIVRLSGLAWTRFDFARGWLITGDTGSGKTTSGIVQLMNQLFEHVPNWGGLCVDEKGVFWETLTAMAAHHGRPDHIVVLQVRPENENPGWQPHHRFNPVGDRSIPWSTYAHLVVDAAQDGGEGHEQSFFRQQAELHIAGALEALDALGYDVTLENACELLTKEAELTKAVTHLRQLSTAAATSLAERFEDQLLRAPFEQRAGVTSTVLNYLRHFTEPDIAEVFCRDSTVQLGELDSGIILCLLMPHRHKGARRHVGIILKSLVYLHVMRRYNLSAADRAAKNLLSIWVDEAQRFVTASRNHGEAAVADLVREAGCGIVLATQSITSLNAALGESTGKVLCLNLRNRIAFKSADEADAKETSGRLGRRKKKKVTISIGRGGRQRSETMEDDFIISPDTLRNQRPHECLIIHCRKGHRRRVLRPLLPDGRVAPWFR